MTDNEGWPHFCWARISFGFTCIGMSVKQQQLNLPLSIKHHGVSTESHYFVWKHFLHREKSEFFRWSFCFSWSSWILSIRDFSHNRPLYPLMIHYSGKHQLHNYANLIPVGNSLLSVK